MKNSSIILAITLLAILTFSCQSNPTTPESPTQTVSMPLVDAMMAPFSPKMQTFTVSSDKPSLVTGKAGTKIHVQPQNLTMPDGSPIQGDIQVNLIECTKKSELLGAGLQTVSDGKLLESGGSYYIDMQASGQALAIKEGQSVEVEFPQVTDRSMELFYGDKNEVGQMNWEVANVDFEAKEAEAPAAIYPRTETIEYTADSMGADTTYAYISGSDTIMSNNMDDIFAFIAKEDGNLTKDQVKEYNRSKGNLKGKPKNLSREERNQQAMLDRRANSEEAAKNKKALSERQRAQQEQSRIARAQSDSINAVAANQLNWNKPTYTGVNLDRFGWYNCDRFYGESNLAQFAVQLPAANESGIVYVVLRGSNSIIQLPYGAAENPLVNAELPSGQFIEVFVVEGQDKDGKMGFAHGTATVGENEQLKLQPIVTATTEIKAAFDKI